MKKLRDQTQREKRRIADHHRSGNERGATRAQVRPGRQHAAKSQESAIANGRQHGILRGWKAIAEFLALPMTTAQRWAKSGMPVHREGRFTVADRDELRGWLGRESEMAAPAHIATDSADLAAGLRQSISAVRRQRRAA